MADEPVTPPQLGQTEAAAQSAAKNAPAPGQDTSIQRFKQWTKDQATGYVKGIYERGKQLALEETGLRPLTELFGPSSFSTMLKGTSDIYTDLTRARPKDDLQRVPPPERIPDLKLSFTRINTGLGAGVDSVLQRSQNEVVKALTDTYDVLKDRVYSTQKSITILDRNVRTVDVRTKKFEGQITSTVDKLTAQLEKLSRTQDRIGQQFQKIEPPERRDATRAGAGDTDWSDRFVELWAGKKGLQWLAKTFGMTIAGLGGIGAAVSTALLMKGDEPEFLKKRQQEIYGQQDKAAAEKQAVATQKLREWMKTHPGQRPPRDILSAAGFYSTDFWDDMKQWFFGARTGGTTPAAPGAPPIVGGLGALGTLFGPSSAQAAERDGRTVASQTPRTTSSSAEVSVQNSILLKSSRDVDIKGSRITIEAGDIIFKGRITGLPTGAAGGGPGRETGAQGWAGAAEPGWRTPDTFGVRVSPTGPGPWAPGMGATTMGPPLYGNWGGPSAAVPGGLGRAGGPSAAAIMGATPSAASGLTRGGGGGLARAGGLAAPGGGAQSRAGGPSASAGGPAFRGAGGAARAGAGPTTGIQPFVPTPPTGELARYMKQQFIQEELAATPLRQPQGPPTTMFGPKAPGIPETPGYFGLTGNVIGALQTGATAFGAFFGGGAAATGAALGGYAYPGGGGGRGGGGGGGGEAAAPPVPELPPDQQKALENLFQTGSVDINDPNYAWLKKLPEDKLKELGITKEKQEGTQPGASGKQVAGPEKEVFKYTPPTLSAEETKKRILEESGRAAGATGNRKVSGETLDNIVSHLMAGDSKLGLKGMTKAEATIMAANFYQEGGFSMKAVGDPSVPGGSHGLAQWNRQRWNQGPNSLQAKAKEWGMDYTAHDTQVKFALWEMQKGGYQTFWKDYQAAVAAGDTMGAYNLVRGKYEVGIKVPSAFKEGMRLLEGQKAMPTRQAGDVTDAEVKAYQENYQKTYGKTITPKIAALAIASGAAPAATAATPKGGAAGVTQGAVAPGGASMTQVDEYLYQKFLKGDASARAKAQKGADREGMSLKEYAIGGVDPKVRVNMYSAGQAMDKKGIDWHINGAYRSDWQQSIATGSMVGKPGYSRHGGSISTGGYGKGQAFDIGGEGTFEWVEASGDQYGLGHPYPKADRPHVGPTGMPEMAHKRPSKYDQPAYEKITAGQIAALAAAPETQVAQAPAGQPPPAGGVDLRVKPGETQVASLEPTHVPEVTPAAPTAPATPQATPALPAAEPEGGDISIKKGQPGYDVKPVAPAIPGGTPRLDEAAKIPEGERAKVPEMPAAAKPAVTPTDKRRAAGAYPGAQPAPLSQDQKKALLPEPGLTTRVTPPLSVKEKPLAPPAKPAEKAPDSVVRKKEPSNPKSGPDVHKGKEVATQPKENKQSRAEGREPSAGDGGSGGGGGGTSPDHCHFCDP